MKKHELKMKSEYFKVAWARYKPFEIRKNDREFQERDEIILSEVDSWDEFSGRQIHGIIDYVTTFAQKKGYVVFSYRETFRKGCS